MQKPTSKTGDEIVVGGVYENLCKCGCSRDLPFLTVKSGPGKYSDVDVFEYVQSIAIHRLGKRINKTEPDKEYEEMLI